MEIISNRKLCMFRITMGITTSFTMATSFHKKSGWDDLSHRTIQNCSCKYPPPYHLCTGNTIIEEGYRLQFHTQCFEEGYKNPCVEAWVVHGRFWNSCHHVIQKLLQSCYNKGLPILILKVNFHKHCEITMKLTVKQLMNTVTLPSFFGIQTTSV